MNEIPCFFSLVRAFVLSHSKSIITPQIKLLEQPSQGRRTFSGKMMQVWKIFISDNLTLFFVTQISLFFSNVAFKVQKADEHRTFGIINNLMRAPKIRAQTEPFCRLEMHCYTILFYTYKYFL